MLGSAWLLLFVLYLKEVHPASIPVPPPACHAPTLDDARAHLAIDVKATLTGRTADGTLIADQLLEQAACRAKLNMMLRGARPDFDRLRALFDEAIRSSRDGHIFVVTVTLSGPVSETSARSERDGPADVSLDVASTRDARIVEVFLAD